MEEGVWHRETGCGTERQGVAQRDRMWHRETGCVMLVWMIRVMKETVVRQHEWH